MSKKIKLNKNAVKQPFIKTQDPEQAKKEPKKESQETQESKLAKQIIDLQNTLQTKEKDMKTLHAKIDELKQILIAKDEEYKSLMNKAAEQANALVKMNYDETEKKFKKDLAEAKKYAIEEKALELIDIVSKFSTAVNHPVSDPKIANWLQGFKMFNTMLNSLLNDLGIEQIEAKIGQEFNPNFMQCFEETIKDPSKPNNTIVQILEPGYKLYDHILKPVLVKVVKNN